MMLNCGNNSCLLTSSPHACHSMNFKCSSLRRQSICMDPMTNGREWKSSNRLITSFNSVPKYFLSETCAREQDTFQRDTCQWFKNKQMKPIVKTKELILMLIQVRNCHLPCKPPRRIPIQFSPWRSHPRSIMLRRRCAAPDTSCRWPGDPMIWSASRAPAEDHFRSSRRCGAADVSLVLPRWRLHWSMLWRWWRWCTYPLCSARWKGRRPMSPPGPPIIRRSPTAGRVHCADSGSCLSATTYVAVVNGCVCEVGLSLFFFGVGRPRLACLLWGWWISGDRVGNCVVWLMLMFSWLHHGVVHRKTIVSGLTRQLDGHDLFNGWYILVFAYGTQHETFMGPIGPNLTILKILKQEKKLWRTNYQSLFACFVIENFVYLVVGYLECIWLFFDSWHVAVVLEAALEALAVGSLKEMQAIVKKLIKFNQTRRCSNEM